MTKCSFGFHEYTKWTYTESQWTRTSYYGETYRIMKKFRSRECNLCGKIQEEFVSEYPISKFPTLTNKD